MLTKEQRKIVGVFNTMDTKSIIETALKLGEEAGEVGGAVLSYSDTCACGYKKKTVADVLEEIADVFIVGESLKQRLETLHPESTANFEGIVNKKLDKWRFNLQKQEELKRQTN